MRLLKRAVKALLQGSFTLTARAVNAFCPPLLVLAYHRVADCERDPQMLAVSPENFAAHLAYIAENNFDVVRFDRPWEAKSSQVRICITFDDGYADNYHNALPILEKFNFPATFFVSTGHVLTGNAFWWDTLEGVLGNALPAAPPPPPFSDTWPNTSERLYAAWHTILRDAPSAKREELLDSFCNWLGGTRKAKDSHRPLNVDEAALLSKHPLATIGAHTHSHARLVTLTPNEQKHEIAQSLDCIDEWTGKRPVVFAYPYGSRGLLGRGGDFSRETMDICRELGVFRAAANYPSQVRIWTNRYAVPRHLIRNWDTAIFAEQLFRFQTTGHF